MLALRAQVLRSWRAKQALDVSGKVSGAIAPVLSDAMLVAQYVGARESVGRAKSGGVDITLKLAKSPYAGALQALAKYRKLTKIDADKTALKVCDEAGQRINKDLRNTIADLIERGAHIDEGVEVLGERFDALGLTPTSGYRLETLFRTHVQLAYNAGRWNADQDDAIQDILWGYRYSTVGDDRVRPSHAELDGVTLPKNHPLWKRIFPPNGWNCRCAVIPLFKARAERKPPKGFDGPDEGFDFNPGLVLAHGLWLDSSYDLRFDFDETQHPRDDAGRFAPVSSLGVIVSRLDKNHGVIHDAKLEVYRSGPLKDLHGRGIFFGGDIDSVEGYRGKDSSVDGYVVRVDRALYAKGHDEMYRLLFPSEKRDFFEAVEDENLRQDSLNVAQRTVEKKMAARARDRGYDALLYTDPDYEKAGGRRGPELALLVSSEGRVEKTISLDFDEAQHPRDDHGKFTDSSGGTATKEPPRHRPRRGVDVYVANEDSDFHDLSHELFGKKLDHDELIGLAGVVGPDADMSVEARNADELRISWSSHNGKVLGERKIYRDENDDLVLENLSFEMLPSLRGQNIGTRMLATQVEQASRLGVKYIKTYAAGDARDSRYNGYYTWPRLGYDADLDSWYSKKAYDKLGMVATQVSDLMKTQAGRDFWKKYGESIDVKFRLKKDSLSRRVLREYLAKKGMADDFELSHHPGKDYVDCDELSDEDERLLDEVWDEIAEDDELSFADWDESEHPRDPKGQFASKDFPNSDSIASLKTIKSLGGTTGAELVEDQHGNRFVRKRGANSGHVTSEHEANELYRAMGVPVPDTRLYHDDKGAFVLSRFHEGKQPKLDEAARDELKKHFVADALLGNWDVTGASGDNLLRDAKTGQILRIDNGGALAYRAQGKLKGSAWNAQVSEIDTMRSPSTLAGSVFAGVTDEQIRDQLKTINERLKGAKLPDMVATRLKTLNERFLKQPKTTAAKPGAKAASKPKTLKPKAYTVHQIAQAYALYKSGKSHSQIAAATGLTAKQSTAIVHKIKYKLLDVDEKLAAAFDKTETISKPVSPAPTLKVPSVPTGGAKVSFDDPEAHAKDWPLGPGTKRTFKTTVVPKLDLYSYEWRDKVGAGSIGSVKSYTGSAFSKINKDLRENPDLIKTKPGSKRIQKALHAYPEPPPPELAWRRIDKHAYEKEFANVDVGDEIRLRGFQSTTLDPEHHEYSTDVVPVLEIKPRAGAWIKPFSHYSNENEYLLPHNARYRIVGKTKLSAGRPVIQLEMLDAGDKV